MDGVRPCKNRQFLLKWYSLECEYNKTETLQHIFLTYLIDDDKQQIIKFRYVKVALKTDLKSVYTLRTKKLRAAKIATTRNFEVISGITIFFTKLK